MRKLIDQVVFLGFLFALTVLTVAPFLLISACSDNNPPPPPSSDWQTYGGNEPAVINNSFEFPGPSGVAGYFYKQTPAKTGQTLALNYSIIGSNPVWKQHVQADGSSDIDPASMTLFLWRNGDDLGCGSTGKASWRLWYPQRAVLKLGDNQVLSGPLDPNVWTNCAGKVDPAGFTAALANQLGLGFTFGGGNFYGHGVYLSSGSATFKINSFMVQ